MKTDMIFGKLPQIESTNLEISKIQEADLNEVYAIYSNDRVFEYCGILSHHNIETVRKMIGHFERDYNKKSRVKWGIFLKNEGRKMVGIIEAIDFDHKVNKVTIGYFLSEEYWGRGIATEAVSALIKFLFEMVGLNRIQAEVMPGNEASKKVLINNGFIKEGLLRQASLWSGKGIVDLEVYAILKEDWEG